MLLLWIKVKTTGHVGEIYKGLLHQNKEVFYLITWLGDLCQRNSNKEWRFVTSTNKHISTKDNVHVMFKSKNHKKWYKLGYWKTILRIYYMSWWYLSTRWNISWVWKLRCRPHPLKYSFVSCNSYFYKESTPPSPCHRLFTIHSYQICQ